MAHDNRPTRVRACARAKKALRRAKNRALWMANRPLEVAELRRQAARRRLAYRRNPKKGGRARRGR